MCAKNIANDTAADEDQWTFVFDATIPLTCLIVSISCYVCLQTFFKRLHNIIKNILIVVSIHNGVTSFVAASLFLIWSEDTSFEKCTILFTIGKSTAFLAGHNLSLISYVRYHLALKTAKAKAINVPFIMCLVISVYVIEYLLHFSVALGTKTSLIETCMNNKPNGVNEYVPVFDFFKSLTSLAFGFYYDGLLLLFLKNQNQIKQATGQDQVVPWKSGSDTYDYNVPIGATAISLLTTCVGSFLMVTFVANNNNLQMLTNGYIFPSILLPCLLLLTIRTALEHKPKPQVPQGLCFHNSSNETEMEDIQAEEEVEQGDEAQEAHDDDLEQNYDLEIVNDVGHQVIFVQQMEAQANEMKLKI